jgi:hypothetical protein
MHWLAGARPGKAVASVQLFGSNVALGHPERQTRVLFLAGPLDDRLDELVAHARTTVSRSHPHRDQLGSRVCVNSAASSRHLTTGLGNELRPALKPKPPGWLIQGGCLFKRRGERLGGVGQRA